MMNLIDHHLPPSPPGLEAALGMLLAVLSDPDRSAAMLKALGETRDQAIETLLQVEAFRAERHKATVELNEMRRQLNEDRSAFDVLVETTKAGLTERELAVSVREVKADERDKKRHRIANRIREMLAMSEAEILAASV